MIAILIALLAPSQPASPPIRGPVVEVTDDDPVGSLDALVERFRKTGRGFADEDAADVRVRLRNLRGLANPNSSTYGGERARREAAIALVDMLTAGLAAALERDLATASVGDDVRRLAREELEWLLDDDLVTWLAGSVLVLREGQPAEWRAALMRVLHDRRTQAVLLALAVCARDPDPAVREPAFQALVGWDDESVHALFLRQLEHPGADVSQVVVGAAESHFGKVELSAKSRVLLPLAGIVRRGLTSEDWRVAVGAIGLSRALDDRSAIPPLIEALSLWNSRIEAGRPFRRMSREILRQLQERAGRKIGSKPENWRTWWTAVVAGRTAPRTPEEAGGGAQTTAAFFGLRPVTDRVVFVIDRSGSMAWDMRGYVRKSANAEDTRYRQAVSQMLQYLEGLGEQTRFNVVLFNEGTDVWHAKLERATPANLRSVETWLLRRHPGGGTFLRAGVERAMRLRADGSVDLEQLQADTIIVLCDGFETGGSAWILPVLRSVNSRSRLVIHSVLIGGQSDGSLELLAEETGGDFVRIDN